MKTIKCSGRFQPRSLENKLFTYGFFFGFLTYRKPGEYDPIMGYLLKKYSFMLHLFQK